MDQKHVLRSPLLGLFIQLCDARGNPLSDSVTYTLPQYAYVLYPEYGYRFGTEKVSTLELRTSDEYAYYEYYT